MRTINSSSAHAPIGPYSHGMVVGNLLFAAGLGGINPKTGSVSGDIADQTAITFQNVLAVLKAAGLGWQNVVKVNLFLLDINDFDSVNRVYAKFAGNHKPPRTCVAVQGMPAGEKVKMEVIACLESSQSS